MHNMGKTVNELHAMLKLHEQPLPKKNAPALHAIRAVLSQVAEEEIEHNFGSWWFRKLKPGALSLYVDNGQREAVEAIIVFYLCLLSGLEIVLNNCHYAPSITRGVIYVSYLYEDGFINRFVNNIIQVSRNNMVYFSAILRDGIFEIDLSNSYKNESSIYAEVENQLGKTIKLLRSDREGEYMSQEFLDHLKDHEIIAHRTPPYTSQHNRVSERRNKTLLDMVRSMMSQTTLPKSFWDYALETAARILNMFPTKKVEKTPYEVWHGQAPKLYYLKVWGCEALVKRDTLTKPDKLEPRSIKCIFMGYPKETMGYSFYYPPENKNYNMHNMGKTVNELHAMLKLHEQPLPKKNAPALHAIRAVLSQVAEEEKEHNFGSWWFRV
nr:retrovirus-related Pol polyprotein from transposon TNT 1-94 [Tanacetum cinerariifolium]